MRSTEFHAYYKLRDLFGTRYAPITQNIMDYLSASEISFMRYMLKIKDEFPYSHKYLNPLRDIDPTMKSINHMIENGYTVLLIGSDTHKLMERIMDPHKYWKRVEGLYEFMEEGDDKYMMKVAAKYENRLKCWLICFDPYSATLGNMMHATGEVGQRGVFVDETFKPADRMRVLEDNFMLQKHNIPGLQTDLIDEFQEMLRKLAHEISDEPDPNEYVDMPVCDVWPCSLQPTFIPSTFEYEEKIIMGRTTLYVEWISLLNKYKSGETPIFTYIDTSSNPFEINEIEPKSDIRSFVRTDLVDRGDRVRFTFRTKNPDFKGNNRADTGRDMIRQGFLAQGLEEQTRRLVTNTSEPEYTRYYVDLQLRRPLTGA